MELTFIEIGDKLFEYRPVVNVRTNQLVRKYIIMNSSITEFEKNCIYVTKPRDFPNHLLITSYVNVILIANDPIPSLFKSNDLINLIVIPDNDDAANILNELQNIFTTEAKLSAASSDLLNALSRGCKLQEILDLGAKLLGNPILLVDVSTSVLAYAGINESIDEPAWNSHIQHGYITQEYYKLYEKEIQSAFKNQNKDKPLLIESKIWKHKIILQKATYQKTILAFIEVLDYNKKFKISDLELVELISNAIGIVIQRSNCVSCLPESQIDASIVNLLSNKDLNNEQFIELADMLDIKSKDNLFLLCLDLRKVAEANSKIIYLKNKAERIIPNNHAVIHNGLIVLLLIRKEPSLNSEEIIHIKNFMTNNNLIIGISRAFHNLSKIYEQYNFAILSIKLGMLLKPKNKLYFYDEYMPYHLIDICSNHADLTKLCLPELNELILNDKSKKTEFTMSLYYFIKYNFDMQKTSEILHIHYNTLKYRLQRIEDVYKVNIHNEQMQLNLRLSFLMIEYIYKTDFENYLNKISK